MNGDKLLDFLLGDFLVCLCALVLFITIELLRT